MQKTALQFLVAIVLFTYTDIYAQDEINLQVTQIDTSLTKDANAVVRSEEVVIEINSISSVTVKTKRIVTVFNKYGKTHTNSREWYDPTSKIKKLEATIYNALGKEIKKYKKKDFNDRSVYDGSSLAEDGRIKYFEYTPVSYPYTLSYESVIERSSTAFIRAWKPIRSYRLGIERSSYKILNQKSIPLRVKKTNFEDYEISQNVTDQEVLFLIADIPAKIPEVNSPSFSKVFPIAKVALNEFSLKGVPGAAVDWKSMGRWQYENLVFGRDKLPNHVIEEVSKLVSNVKSNREKAKLIYEYVQENTRYISIQLGIGGWMPMLAEDVDRLGYGDCKALTNYTKALLDSQNISSNYCVVWRDYEKIDIDPDFASMEGNHVILNIPDDKEDDIWLECTSQTLPFNFNDSTTDDRNVLVIKPEGGEIKRTKKYAPEENLLSCTAKIDIKSDTSMSASIKRISEGLQYDWRYSIQFKTPKDQKLRYKENWDYINNLEVSAIKLDDDRDAIKFKEEIKVSCSSYGKKAGSRLLITPNLFNCEQHNFPKYKNRQTPLVIRRGYIETDEYIINLPKGYALGNLPEKKIIETEFGKYSYELEKIADAQIRFKRYLKIVDGTFPKEKYEEYRSFRAAIKKTDKSRIVLKQS